MHFYDQREIDSLLEYPSLIEALRKAFAGEVKVPQRMHIDYASKNPERDNTLLLMPAIQEGNFGGVKIVNVVPENAKRGIASIQGVYLLFDATTGLPKALFDAKSLTNWRTAATSALAADYLARKDADSLLMVGTGSLAPYMIKAHAAIRPIKRLKVYGRNQEKAERLAADFRDSFDSIEVCNSVEEGIDSMDIICTATMSELPLVKGDWLKGGQHLDLVGSYRVDTREVDDQAMLRASKFVDTEVATRESGDLVIPLREGVFEKTDIKSDLAGLCTASHPGREGSDEITLFKSVGYALEDLVGAEEILKQANNG